MKLVSGTRLRILSFDLETLAAGYADPAWVPDKITCAAWSWVGEKRVHSLITGKDGFFSRELRGERIRPLLDAIAESDTLIGHNVVRFDLRTLQAECMRFGFPKLRPVRVQDTIRLGKTKGLKKGQDDLSYMVGSPVRKQTMNWEQWDRAYEEDDWATVISRCVTDVKGHKVLWERLRDRGYLQAPTMWAP